VRVELLSQSIQCFLTIFFSSAYALAAEQLLQVIGTVPNASFAHFAHVGSASRGRFPFPGNDLQNFK
jgi:hypothetical protein